MEYIKLEDVKKILSDMQFKVTATQLPALDRFKSAVEGLDVYHAQEMPPNTPYAVKYVGMGCWQYSDGSLIFKG